MNDNFDSALQMVLVHEGGFSDHPNDPGGATMKGVTLTTFRRFFGNDKSVGDLKNITTEQLAQIYRTGFWNVCSGDDLPAGLDYAVFDLAVNSGPGRAAKFLQTSVGATADGSIGEQTLAKVKSAAPPNMINSVCDQRMTFLRSLKTFEDFGKGWTKRVEDVRQKALDMAGGTAVSAAPDTNFDIVKLNSTGAWVIKLQAALGLKQDGQFGPATEASLKAFQAEHGLVADGVAGRNTYRALGLLA